VRVLRDGNPKKSKGEKEPHSWKEFIPSFALRKGGQKNRTASETLFLGGKGEEGNGAGGRRISSRKKKGKEVGRGLCGGDFILDSVSKAGAEMLKETHNSADENSTEVWSRLQRVRQEGPLQGAVHQERGKRK